MEYNKPTVVRLAEAASAIQGGKGIAAQDSPDTNPAKTVPAYEADE
jgi:hypothetical protein